METESGRVADLIVDSTMGFYAAGKRGEDPPSIKPLFDFVTELRKERDELMNELARAESELDAMRRQEAAGWGVGYPE